MRVKRNQKKPDRIPFINSQRLTPYVLEAIVAAVADEDPSLGIDGDCVRLVELARSLFCSTLITYMLQVFK